MRHEWASPARLQLVSLGEIVRCRESRRPKQSGASDPWFVAEACSGEPGSLQQEKSAWTEDKNGNERGCAVVPAQGKSGVVPPHSRFFGWHIKGGG